MKKYLYLCLAITALFSQWSSSPENPIIMGSGIQPQMAASSDGSLFIAWLNDSNFHVYLQLLNSEGIAQFNDDGLLVSNHPNETWIAVFHLNLAIDSEGNVILSFVDTRTGSWNAFAYKISPNGDFLWGVDGIQLSFNSTGNISPRVTVLPDNSTVVSWDENFSIIHAQRITPDGTLTWGPNGIIISDTGASLVNPTSIMSDDGNLLLRWIRQTGPYWSPTSEILTQKYDSSGSTLWTVPAPITGQVSFPMGNWHQRLESDQANGSYSAWTAMTTNSQSGFAQRTDPDGVIMWEQGVELSTQSDHFRTNPTISVSQESHEMTAVWTQANGAQNQHGIYAQRLSMEGARQWGNNGLPAVALNTQYSYLDLATSSVDEDAIAVYIRQTSSMQGDLFAFRLNLSGELVWNPYNIQITTSGVSKSDATIIPGPGCVFITWVESGDIRAHCLRTDGTLGAPLVEEECIADGDVNFDGYTNVLDIVSVVNFIVGLQTPTPDQIYAADLNSDDSINVLDIVIIVNMIVGG